MVTPRADIKAIAAAALASASSLLPQWLPDGRREGHEWKALNPTRADSKVGSFSVNLNTGAWADFATGDKGGDAIALLAYLDGIPQLEAAKRLAERLGVRQVGAGSGPVDPAPAAKPATSRSEWEPVVPAPPGGRHP